MKLRIEGTEAEIRTFISSLRDIVAVASVSRFYENRESGGKIGRVYINLVEPERGADHADLS